MRTWLCLLALTSLKKCSEGKKENGQASFKDRDSAEEGHPVGFGSSFSMEMSSNEMGNVDNLDDVGHSYSRQNEKHGEKLYSVKTTSAFSTTSDSERNIDAKYPDDNVPADRQRDLILGVPDLSDPCFRAYNECIVISAQPYERRSNVQLQHCKQRCMHSQSGIYSCRSLVFDTANQICDLFAHQGDQEPAKLLRYQEHLYLEPTFADGCDAKYAKKSKKATTSAESQPTNPAFWTDLTGGEQEKQQNCEEGKVVKYLRTQGFELDSSDRLNLKAYSLSACSDACTRNNDGKGHDYGCRSFDYSEGRCRLSAEAAAPIGSRQLKQNFNANYYEKFCIGDDLMSSECRIINRFPQMILVGFAEAVVTAESFMECIANCLKSRQLFAMNCTSAMYFYEEVEQNCILNKESRLTQKNLFVEENTDIVDYFEASCPLRKRKKIVKDDLPLKS